MLFSRRVRCLFDLGTIQETDSDHLHNHRIAVNLVHSHFALDCADLALAVELVHCFHQELIITT